MEQSFVVLGQSSTLAEPGEGALDNPALASDLKAGQVGPFDDLKLPAAKEFDALDQLARITRVREDRLQACPTALVAANQHQPAVAILPVGGRYDGVRYEAQSVDNHVALHTLDLLASVEPAQTPPFSTVFTLCESMMAALGWASRGRR